MGKKLFFLQLFMLLLFLILSLSKVQAGTGDIEDYTYSLNQSTAGYTFWKAPPSRRIFKDDEIPTESDSIILVYAASNEFEPVQLVVQPSVSGNVTVIVGDFDSGIESELFRVEYITIAQASDNLGKTAHYPDPLMPLENGDSVFLTPGENSAFWVLFKIPAGKPAGDYNSVVSIGTIDIPIQLPRLQLRRPGDGTCEEPYEFQPQHDTRQV